MIVFFFATVLKLDILLRFMQQTGMALSRQTNMDAYGTKVCMD